MTYDALIIGGGPAGLAAAIFLGRYLRPTLVLDQGKTDSPWHMPTAHNVFGFPAGITRAQLLMWGHAHLHRYESVEVREATVTHLDQVDGGFRAWTEDGQSHAGRAAILATGQTNELPDIPGILDYAGRTVHHCAECDGYEARDKRLVIIGNGRATAGYALGFKVWTDEITLCTHGAAPDMDRESWEKLRDAGVAIVTDKIVGLEGDSRHGKVQAIRLHNGRTLAAEAIFTNYPCEAALPLVEGLGVEVGPEGHIKVDKHQQTSVRGLYAAGDAVAPDHKLLTIAVADGVTAAVNLHYALMPEELRLEKNIVRSYEDEGWLPPQVDQLPPEQQSLPGE